MTERSLKPARALAGALLSVLVTACGGGGSGSAVAPPVLPEPPSAPAGFVLTPQPTKTFSFTWSDGIDETEYRLLESPAMGEGFTEIATLDANAESYELAVSLPARINARYILQACNAGGCMDSDTAFVSGSLAEAVGYFKASNTDAGDQFGWSVALSGDTLVMGAPSEGSNAIGVNDDEANNTAFSSGAAYVFERNGTGTWVQQAYLKASNADAFDNFGRSIALAGDTLVVGAPNEASSATGVNGNQSDNSAPGGGAAYVFVRTEGIWSQQAYLKASNTDDADDFGWSVAVAGDTVVVGARREDIDAAASIDENSGAVYVFLRSGVTWGQQAYVKPSNADESDQFGGSVALFGDTLVVGARGEASSAIGVNGNQSDNSAPGSGAAYVFVRTAATWNQQAYLKASNTDASDGFGHSVALSDDTLVVGAPQEDSSATGFDGSQSDNGATSSGAVYVFVRTAATWNQQAYLKASNTDARDDFGHSVALFGDTLVVGAPGEDGGAMGVNGDEIDDSVSRSGAAYVHARAGATWTQQGYLKASNTDGSDKFGESIALDGNTLVVGSPFESSSALGANGDQSNDGALYSGAVYVY